MSKSRINLKALQGQNRVIPFIDYVLDARDGIKLELGCGKNTRPGYIGVDKFKHEKVDIVCDLEDASIPMGDGVVTVVRAIHVMEHIQNVEGLWNEIARICYPGALIYVVVPHPMGPWYFQDPTHKAFYTEKTFMKYFDGEFVQSYSDYGFNFSMKPVSVFIHGKTFDKLAVHAVMEVIK